MSLTEGYVHVPVTPDHDFLTGCLLYLLFRPTEDPASGVV